MHNFFRVTTSSINFFKNAKSDILSLQVYNNSPYKKTLLLGLLGYCETNATFSPTVETAYRVNIIQQLLDIRQSTILNEESSNNNITSDSKQNTDYFTKTRYQSNVQNFKIHSGRTTIPYDVHFSTFTNHKVRI